MLRFDQRKSSGFCALLLVAMFNCPAGLYAQNTLSPKARISVLTCTPGPDLYSLFGHTAIRVEDVNEDGRIDEVYNYGTFQFDDDFYYNFIKGRLNYSLSKIDFGTFQLEYLYSGRGISEQVLLLDSADSQRLYDLLIENYRPENRDYRYDYFYDNCSSRVGEIIRNAGNGEVRFNYVSDRPYSFREAIDRYLVHMPWADFGIDLALGMPCDYLMDGTQDMFLPDSLLNQLAHASYRLDNLASRSIEILPAEFFPDHGSWWTPFRVMLLVLLLHVMVVRFFRSSFISVADRILLFVTGAAGCLLAFLWFFTDHSAAAWNFNILWANPLNLIIALLPSRVLLAYGYRYFRSMVVMIAILFLGWPFFPQDLHEAILPIVFGLGWLGIRLTRSARPQPKLFDAAQ